MMRRVPCLERIKKEIDWQPNTELNTTLRIIVGNSRVKL